VWFVPTGGVTVDLLDRYLAEPSVMAVGGSWMVEPRLIAAGDWAEITTRTADAVGRTRAARQ
jgi:2-dehydro-3-deoxyphosphogluconate aldolase/(4S)-4-hydroxy-2-oxoglutarate aldolase